MADVRHPRDAATGLPVMTARDLGLYYAESFELSEVLAEDPLSLGGDSDCFDFEDVFLDFPA
jgi:hypothetical protein